jgi:hypothetical protein
MSENILNATQPYGEYSLEADEEDHKSATNVAPNIPGRLEILGYGIRPAVRGGGLILFKGPTPIEEIPQAESKRKELARDHKIPFEMFKTAILNAKTQPKEAKEDGDSKNIKQTPGDGFIEQIIGGRFAAYTPETETVEIIEQYIDGDTVNTPMVNPLWPLADNVEIPRTKEDFKTLYRDVYNFVYDHVDYGPKESPYHIHTAFILCTWVPDLFNSVPYRKLDGVPKVGKTRSEETTKALGYRPILSSNISEAAIFRIIEQYHPTLLLDEVDRFTKDKNDTIQNILNNGYRRGTPAIRMEKIGDKQVPCFYNVFGPKELAGTAMLSQATETRTIRQIMEKKTRHIRPLINEKSARKLRGRLLGYRFKMLATYKRPGGLGDFGDFGDFGEEDRILEVMNALEEYGFESRQIELFTPLLMLCLDDETEKILKFMAADEEQKRLEESESLDAKTVNEITNIHETAKDTKERYFSTIAVTDSINANLNEGERISITRIGGKIKNLGYTKQKDSKTGKVVWLIDYEKTDKLKARYEAPDKVQSVWGAVKKFPKFFPYLQNPPESPNPPNPPEVAPDGAEGEDPNKEENPLHEEKKRFDSPKDLLEGLYVTGQIKLSPEEIEATILNNLRNGPLADGELARRIGIRPGLMGSVAAILTGKAIRGKDSVWRLAP